ncbi:MAG TPA: FecR domain-containing protein [Elusimicrobiota bacterium]|nr:FecR domain-containing protein [Elusimicrobiota bacterium]
MRAILLAIAALAATAPGHAAERAVTIARIDGSAPVSNGKPLQVGQKLEAQAEIQVPSGSKVALRAVQAGNVLLIGPAVLRLESAEPELLAFELARGRLLAVLPRLRGRFALKTGNAVAAVRGTEFYVERRSGKLTHVCLCSGKIWIYDRASGELKARLNAEHHAPYDFSSGRKGLRSAPAPMVGHTDKDLAELRAL